MLANAKDHDGILLGMNLITAGLGIQVLFFGCFVIVAGTFHYRIRLCPTSRIASLNVPWEQHLLVLYLATFLILVRSVFRIAEYVLGTNGTLLGHEVYLYIFDATLVFIVMVIFNIWHPSKIISRKSIHAVDSNESMFELENQAYGRTK